MSDNTLFERPELKVQDVVQLHALFLPTGGVWIHTHGLVTYGYPELEIRDIPGFMVDGAGRLLNRIGQYMLKTKAVIHADENMQLDDNCILSFIEDPLDDEDDHYEVERLRIVDPPGMGRCERCEDRECEH